MVEVIVYHGSHIRIDKIDLLKCEPNKDFGQGFYVTKFRQQAEAWAVRIGNKHKTKGVVTEFVFYESAFTNNSYRTFRFDKYDDNWLDFVTLNRRFDSTNPAHDYDIVEGPVADARISIEVTRYIDGKISREKFLSMLRREEPTHQICFCTADSLLMLKSKEEGSDIFYEIEETGEKITEQLVLDFDFDAEKATDLFFSSVTFGRLSDYASQLYLKPWHDIYEMLKQELNLQAQNPRL